MPSSLRIPCSFPNFTQQAYRYGIALSCIGVLLNWLGVAQAYIEPVRYLGVGLVIIGSFLIIAAMFRWMFLSPHPSTVHEVNSEATGDLHVITVPMGRTQSQSRTPGTSAASQGKPPDYFLVTEKPPSYEEAMSMLPKYAATHSGSLQLNTEGGLEDFLAPHQVPESYPEGATGGCISHTNPRRESASPPPAYSSQLSLCASPSTSGNSNNATPPLSNSTSGLHNVQSFEAQDTRASTINVDQSDGIRNDMEKTEEKDPKIEKAIIKKSEEK
ncbi:uncharacterized protein LOC135206263 [Macrobrachium nipponense]|uniref:uncharacterized protein LOC135206263 n=1 Tax=Macrobrachium nipponense TaxID=159736 RepID=UPI0030C7E7D2